MFHEIVLEFREISQNTNSKFGQNFRYFANHEIQKLGTIFQKNYDFLVYKKMQKHYLFLGHIVHKI